MRAVTPDLLRADPLPDPVEGAGKDQRGRVLIVAGGRSVPGAAWLAGTAALRAGAGKLHIATARSIAPHLALALPEARVTGLDETREGEIAAHAASALERFAEESGAVLIGPGMLDDLATRQVVHDLLDATTSPRFVLDAAGITALGDDGERLRRHAGRILITPHAGEMASLLGIHRDVIEADPVAAAERASRLVSGVVAMKGACTFILQASGDGEPRAVWSCSQGNVGLATSGSGDVLAGIVCGLLARGAEPLQAMRWAAFLHGEAGNRLAGRIGPIGYLASELLAEIPAVMASLSAA
ncbi:hypothetical protein ASG43_05380 [Aureimonas sp. Leaf454]|uniref:NAD(P)H-hydrate dehydratase n=1 Tax=Aureimonas sp. Leaf454 TaxID=1736381 RepID=UPI0007009537|nr:NAD(P)H-hydrate dehydratase [Aureimonas sp. Leaf454]KQT50714.1 hypothetical protein ASG43_05380 [Aureimonas sp. Leaf454]